MRWKGIARVVLFLSLAVSTSSHAEWNQAYGTLGNTGFVDIPTDLPVASRWAYQLDGPVSAGGPSVAPDGTIYVGTANGTLWGFNPDGTPRCRFNFPSSTITSVPAIVPGGDVVIVLQRFVERDETQGDLVRANANCQPVWQVELPHDEPAFRSVSSGSAKVWSLNGEPFFFVHSRFSRLFDPLTPGESTFHELLVYDKEGNLFARHGVGSGCLRVSGSAGVDLGDVWDVLTFWWPTVGSVPPLYESYGWPDSTPAILDTLLAEYSTPSSPLVAVTEHEGYCHGELRVFQFFPVAPKPEERLVERWRKTVDKEALLSSPAVTADGRVAIGTSNNYLRVYDLATKSQAWAKELKGPMAHPPAITPNIWFAGSDNHLHLLKPTGSLIAMTPSNPRIVRSRMSPFAASQTEVVVLNYDEASILTHDLHGQTHAAAGWIFRTSHPALHSDGSLYVVAQTGEKSVLIAY
jgi:outer membrane protein assembly factor BamB